MTQHLCRNHEQGCQHRTSHEKAERDVIVTYSYRFKHVTLPENYAIIEGVIYDMNTGLRFGCIQGCDNNNPLAESHCNLNEDGKCPYVAHLLLCKEDNETVERKVDFLPDSIDVSPPVDSQEEKLSLDLADWTLHAMSHWATPLLAF